MADEILTVGHSNHSIERFLDLLEGAGIELIADVRRHPSSRRNPQFNAEALDASLAEAGIAYVPLGEDLGGRRSARPEDAFVAYAEHMRTEAFESGLARLEELAHDRRAAPVCAEADWRHCHRRLIADALTARGWRVLHLLADGRLEPHAEQLKLDR